MILGIGGLMSNHEQPFPSEGKGRRKLFQMRHRNSSKKGFKKGRVITRHRSGTGSQCVYHSASWPAAAKPHPFLQVSRDAAIEAERESRFYLRLESGALSSIIQEEIDLRPHLPDPIFSFPGLIRDARESGIRSWVMAFGG
ncbi:hypothetical protein CDAR_237101 [Caerostris darwini]|uniref:Ribosomal protein L2 n=1 Tax=Caerostris darwini TaxID=1538125 RepID=A0AAV4VZX9_9ARAC|nr:hypothetical protein CDAR_237101 [Caerostris darwini]